MCLTLKLVVLHYFFLFLCCFVSLWFLYCLFVIFTFSFSFFTIFQLVFLGFSFLYLLFYRLKYCSCYLCRAFILYAYFLYFHAYITCFSLKSDVLSYTFSLESDVYSYAYSFKIWHFSLIF